jgi:hypothetical protein
MKVLRFASTLLLGFLLTCGIASAQDLTVENNTGKKLVLSTTRGLGVTDHPASFSRPWRRPFALVAV